jgi:hypothetical protein
MDLKETAYGRVERTEQAFVALVLNYLSVTVL